MNKKKRQNLKNKQTNACSSGADFNLKRHLIINSVKTSEAPLGFIMEEPSELAACSCGTAVERGNPRMLPDSVKRHDCDD